MHSTGLLLIVIGGVMEGLFAVPMKFTRNWSWENIWGAGSLAALLLVPWPLALITIPQLSAVYSSAPLSAVLSATLFGAGWGGGGLFFGLGVSALGLSLGISLIMGFIAIGGSIVPMVLQHREELTHGSGAYLVLGIAVMITGLILCSWAGSLRTGKLRGAKTEGSPSFALGLIYCIAAGLLSSLVNFALIFGAPIAQPAMARGVDLATANNAVWAIVFTSNYVVNLGYCIWKAAREKTLGRFLSPSTARYWLYAVVMGALWAGGIVIYGRGASMGGPLGPIFGFPIMLIASILAGNAAGAVSGEWRPAPAAARRTMACGIVVMFLAILTLGYASYAGH